MQPKGTKIYAYDVTVDMPAGDVMALSAGFSDGKHPKLELWGESDKCGIATQKLGAADAGSGVACIERGAATPRQHLLLVLFEDAPLDTVTYCAMGMCP